MWPSQYLNASQTHNNSYPSDLCHLISLSSNVSQIRDSSELGQHLINEVSSQTLDGIAKTQAYLFHNQHC